MDGSSTHSQLIHLLRENGIRFLEDRTADGRTGFPFPLQLNGGETLFLDLPHPGLLAVLDEAQVGIAVLDPIGKVRKTWGLARQISHFRNGRNVVDTPVAGILEAMAGLNTVTLYLDGVRYFASAIRTQSPDGQGEEGQVSDVLVLVVNATEEREAKRRATRSERFGNALKRLGKVLTVEEGPARIAVNAAHEMASSAELAAVLIWRADPSGAVLELSASVGVNNEGKEALKLLDGANGTSCLAELVASTRHAFFQTSVFDHVMSAELEARICYLKPGGFMAAPLLSSDRLVGVVEFVGNAGDATFSEWRDLFETFAEQLGLALNAASLYEEAEKRASHDALTGLANHRTMQEFLNARLAEAERVQSTLGVVMIDVDHFRSFNEEEGHDAGDAVLRLVSDAVRQCLRPYDLAARYGGEEFTLVMPGISKEGLAAVAERIRARIEAAGFQSRGGRERHLSVSLGCAMYPETAHDGQTLLKAADEALFVAKRSGRNRVEMYHGIYDEETDEKSKPTVDSLKWLDLAAQAEALRRMQDIRPEFDYLGKRLALNSAQIVILEALVHLAPPYRLALEEDPEFAKAIESSPESRLLAPSLAAIGERYDGGGPKGLSGSKIPLLARILDVLLALTEASGRPIIDDPSRFDPEIIQLLAELPNAA